MIESVNMVKTLMQTNRDYRQQMEQMSSKLETLDNEQYHLQVENRECRDRIEILESVVTNSQSVADQFSKMDWRAIFANELKTEPAKGDNEAINHMV